MQKEFFSFFDYDIEFEPIGQRKCGMKLMAVERMPTNNREALQRSENVAVRRLNLKSQFSIKKIKALSTSPSPVIKLITY